jgi:hypothetical protein
LKVTTELIENNKVQPIELAKEGAIYTALGNLLISVIREIGMSSFCI